MGNALFVQLYNIAVDEAVIAPANAVTLNAQIDGGPDHSTDAGIHAGSVAAAGQNSDALHTHIRTLQFLKVKVVERNPIAF